MEAPLDYSTSTHVCFYTATSSAPLSLATRRSAVSAVEGMKAETQVCVCVCVCMCVYTCVCVPPI